MTLHSLTSLNDADAVETLATQTTLDRALVHRAAVSEVFLTDMRRTGEFTTRATAQLPGCHGFFNDHRGAADLVDPLLLLETARQATLASAHVLDVPQNTILISRNFDLTLLDGPLVYRGDAPQEIVIESHFEWQAFRGTRPRAGMCRQTIYLDERAIAEHWSDGQLMSHDQLAGLREAQRGTPPAWTTDKAPRSHEDALSAGAVGRWNPLNVVIKEVRIADGRISAQVAPPWQNRALFDHGYDHLTMQLLTEAARQVATLARSEADPDLDSRAATTVSGRFHQFAEVDADTWVQSQRGTDPNAQRVTISQADQTIAEIDIVFVCPRSGRTLV